MTVIANSDNSCGICYLQLESNYGGSRPYLKGLKKQRCTGILRRALKVRRGLQGAPRKVSRSWSSSQTTLPGVLPEQGTHKGEASGNGIKIHLDEDNKDEGERRPRPQWGRGVGPGNFALNASCHIYKQFRKTTEGALWGEKTFLNTVFMGTSYRTNST